MCGIDFDLLINKRDSDQKECSQQVAPLPSDPLISCLPSEVAVVSIDQLIDHIDFHALGQVGFCLELGQLGHDLFVHEREDAADLVDAECGAGRVVRRVLEVADVNVFLFVSLLLRQEEEAGAVEAMRRWVKVDPVELKELSEILRQGAGLIDSELFEES